jgi:hypothetical protein
MDKLKIYLASSWRNDDYPRVLSLLQGAGHDVYDFREGQGFHWSDIDPDWQDWTPLGFRNVLQNHPLAYHGYTRDMHALMDCHLVILLLKSGNSAHLEGGYSAGDNNKRLIIHIPQEIEQFEPELMYLMANEITVSDDELLAALESSKRLLC